jgi:ribonuclease G
MGNELIINVTNQETRVALLENGTLVELHIEMAGEKTIVGNIYKGRVLRVLPGMQAAFVDIGLDRAAFLYVSDVTGRVDTLSTLVEEENDDQTEPNENPETQSLGRQSQPQEYAIEELLREGQEILVQVAKEPIGTKGARITSHISLPGRHLVLMPTIRHVGISRRIEDEQERLRLKELVETLSGNEYGFIVRTAAGEKNEEALKADMELLIALWKNVAKKNEEVGAPYPLHADLSIAMRAIRDLFSSDVDRVVIDKQDDYNKILTAFGKHMPRLNYTIELYEGQEPIFDHYGLEIEISRALQRKVWLKSGGYIVIEQTEALTAIDVNTGRYVGRRNLEDTILKTNLEAVKEICYQLRLRNIGGIIIIDFIDMEKESNREKVYNALGDKLKYDKARTNILKISELGLVEMTRKRTRENINRVLSEPCPYCEGKGYVKSKTAVSGEIFRELQREIAGVRGKSIVLNVHPEIADLLYEQERTGIEFFEHKYDKRIIIKDKPSFHIEQFEIIGM